MPNVERFTFEKCTTIIHPVGFITEDVEFERAVKKYETVWNIATKLAEKKEAEKSTALSSFAKIMSVLNFFDSNRQQRLY